jgi:hypothetical protein
MDSRSQRRLGFDETNLHRSESDSSDRRSPPARRLRQEFADLAEHFRTSPESCRLIELAQSHRSKNGFTEATITQFTVAESVAEYLAMLKRLPHGVFADPRHPALSFN